MAQGHFVIKNISTIYVWNELYWIDIKIVAFIYTYKKGLQCRKSSNRRKSKIRDPR